MGSAATANPFELLIDDENEDPMHMKASVPQKAPKPAPAAAPAPAKADKFNTSNNAAIADTRGEGRGRGRDFSRGGRGGRDFGARGGARSDRPRPQEYRYQETTDDGFDSALASGGRGDGGRGSGRFGGRGGRSGRGRGGDGGGDRADRGPRRDYERRDGTGRGHEEVKRGGRGRGNWGVETEQQPEAVESPIEAEGGSPTTEEAAAPNEADTPPEPEPVPEEPEEKTMSLEEYEKIAAEKRAGLNKTATKSEATDLQTQFTGMASKTKSHVEEDRALDLSRSKGSGARREKEKKVRDIVTDVGFSVEKPEERSGGFRGGRGGRSRGEGRGGGRGGRGGGEYRNSGGEGRGSGEYRGGGSRGGRGEGRGYYRSEGSTPSLDVKDSSAFPTL